VKPPNAGGKTTFFTSVRSGSGAWGNTQMPAGTPSSHRTQTASIACRTGNPAR